MLTLATAQVPIGADPAANGRTIRSAMERAAASGARLVHFPETALSGYPGKEIGGWAQADWASLRRELHATAQLAGQLGLWTVLGANHRLRPPRWPQNCLVVISDEGVLAGRYAKRMCSNTEVTWCYTPGEAPLVFDVDGIRFGCAICIEVAFPAVFAEYERLGATCMLLSCYSADPVYALMARAHAATTCSWVSLSNPVGCSATLPSAVFGPDGAVMAQCGAGQPGMVLHRIDPAEERWHLPLRLARPWRERARSGEIYRAAARPATRTAP